MPNIVLSVKKLSKTFKLYNKQVDRLKEAIYPIKKSYHKKFDALSDVNFEINRGEIVGIIGRNGSGKSTLLKIITGILNPTSGHVTVHGHISAILELGAGFNNEMTGLENIHLKNIINGIPKSETQKSKEKIIEFAELGEFIHQPLKNYSTGMKARLAFAVAINIDPDILIVDEALSVGDAAFQRKCFSKIEEIRKLGTTILFVSHSEANVVSLCNRVIWLSNGMKILDGDPKIVTSFYLKYMNQLINKNNVEQEYVKFLRQSDEYIKHKEVDQIEKPDYKVAKKDTLVNKKINLASFNPKLKSTSALEYDSKFAKIFNVKVTDLEGEEVNILEHGKQYYYSYQVKVTQPLQQVKFGFLLKQKNGIAIGGGAYPSLIENIPQLNKNVNVKFKITANLAQGEYFFNAGIMANFNEKQDYAHRILDAYMVKVINQSPIMTSTVKIVDEAEYELAAT